MDAQDQLDVLAAVWGDRKGFVYLPWIPAEAASSADKNTRKAAWSPSMAFLWPKDKHHILTHLEKYAGNDQYWSPSVFETDNGPRDHAVTDHEIALFADLDSVDPRNLPDDVPTPSIAWETSPGSYQAAWLLNAPVPGATDPGGPNHQLTYHLGADKGGWFGAKMLRVPGSVNNKHLRKGATGKLLWSDGPTLSPSQFAGLPAIPASEIPAASVTSDVVGAVDVREAMKRLRESDEFPRQSMDRLRDRESKDDGDGRALVLHGLAKDMIRAGLAVPDIVAVLQASVWNKFAGRPTELHALTAGVSKAAAEVQAETPTPTYVAPVVIGFNARELMRVARAQSVPWLIKDVWFEGACGWMTGAPKTHKSWSALDMALSVALGKKYLGRRCRKGRVLFIEEEDGKRTIGARLTTVLAHVAPDYSDAPVLTIEDDGTVMVEQAPHAGSEIPIIFRVSDGFVGGSEDARGWLEETIEEYDIDLVIVDTLFATSGGLDIAKPEVQEKMLGPLKAIMRRQNCSLMIVHHNRKPGDKAGGRNSGSMFGSQALHGWADAGIYFGEPDEIDGSVDLLFENKESATTVERWDFASSLNRDQVVVDRFEEADHHTITVRAERAWAPRRVVDGTPAPESPDKPSTGRVEPRSVPMGGGARRTGRRGPAGNRKKLTATEKSIFVDMGKAAATKNADNSMGYTIAERQWKAISAESKGGGGLRDDA